MPRRLAALMIGGRWARYGDRPGDENSTAGTMPESAWPVTISMITYFAWHNR